MTHYRIDVNRKTGEITMLTEAPCGLRPTIAWSNLEAVREFANMLLSFCEVRKEEEERIDRISGDLLRQALGDDKDIL